MHYANRRHGAGKEREVEEEANHAELGDDGHGSRVRHKTQETTALRSERRWVARGWLPDADAGHRVVGRDLRRLGGAGSQLTARHAASDSSHPCAPAHDSGGNDEREANASDTQAKPSRVRRQA